MEHGLNWRSGPTARMINMYSPHFRCHLRFVVGDRLKVLVLFPAFGLLVY